MPAIDHDLLVTSALLIAVSDTTDDLIFVRNCDGELLFANAAALRALGKTKEEARHCKSHALLINAEEADRIDCDDRWVMQQCKKLVSEQTLHMAAGIRTYFTTRSPWFDGDGVLKGIVGISVDITAQKLVEAALRARELQLEATIAERTVELRELTNHIEMVREEEKRAIARELHGEMGATLTSLSMHLQGAYSLFPEDEKWLARKIKIQSLLSDLVATTRRMQTRLQPALLELFGLKTAMSELLTEFGEQSGLVCKVSLPDEDLPINDKVDIALYRMLQEILNNVSKHARASKLDVIVDIDEDRLTLTVRDDGIGIDAARLADTKTYGLRSLRERAAFLGGCVTIGSQAAGGTAVAIQIPLISFHAPAPETPCAGPG